MDRLGFLRRLSRKFDRKVPKATIDALVDGSLHGWAWDREGSVRVDLLHDDTVLARAFEADQLRVDLRDAGHPTGNCGFCIPIPNGLLPAGGRLKLLDTATGALLATRAVDEVPRRTLTESGDAARMLSSPSGAAAVPLAAGVMAEHNASVARVGAESTGGTSTSTDDAREALDAPAADMRRQFSAKIERCSGGLVQGWAVNRLNLADTFTVELLIDGLVYDRQQNNHTRADLERNLGTPGGNGGLRFPLPARIIDGSAKIACQLRLPDGTLTAEMLVQQSEAHLSSDPPMAEPEIAIVVPIYNAVDHVEECIELLERHTTVQAKLILIDDASPDGRVWEALQAVAGRPNIEILRNPENIGFTATCNRGIAKAGRADVVLLNSDARVQPRWLEGLVAAAYSAPRIGTATPLSDRAGAFSAPEIGNANRLPPGVEESEFAVALHRRGRGIYPSVPTGNGFCLYIRRECLDAVGPLDQQAFPRGYGEENEFCMRAWRAGWRHVVADRTYVFHERNVSFGASKDQLILQGRAVVDERFPEYKSAIAVFRDGVQLKNARFQARLAEKDCVYPRQVLPRALFVVSTQTGGTPQTNRDLMAALDGTMECWVLSTREAEMRLSRRTSIGETVVRRRTLEEPVEPLTHRSAEYEQVVRKWMSDFAFDLVHIRHLGWHSVELPRIARESGAAVVMSFHDYYSLCPTVKLIDGEGNFCNGACSAGTVPCRPELWENRTGIPPLRDAWVHRWRSVMGQALVDCDAFVTTSGSARDRILRNLPAIEADRFHVIPHGRDFPEYVRAGEAPHRKLKILAPGNVDGAKGAEIIKALLERDVERRLEIHILGQSTFTEDDRVVSHGTYERDRFVEKVRPIGAHIGIVFSIWDETWCHTLTEMWAAGLPVAVLDFPTVAMRVRESGAGWVLDHGDIDRLYHSLTRICDEPEVWCEKFAKVLKWQRSAAAQSTAVMAANYLNVYRAALDARHVKQKPFVAAGLDQVSVAAKPIAVVCPSGPTLDTAPGSTWVRVWERTRNRLGRRNTFVRIKPSELADAVRSGAIEAAVIQRNALSIDDWEIIQPLASDGRFRYVLDLDDDLLDVPDEKDPEGVYARYAPYLIGIVQAASAVTVSTDILAELMSRHNRNIHVLPNRLSRRIWAGHRKPRKADGTFRALYYGSATHDGDLRMILPALWEFADLHPDFRLRLIEAVSPELAANLPAWVEIDRPTAKQRNYPAFVAWLKEQTEACDIGLCPLEDTDFNRHKSPLKLLEMAGLGLPAIVSEHVVFLETARLAPAAMLAKAETGGWVEALDNLYARRDMLEAAGLMMQDWTMTNFGLADDIDEILQEHLHPRRSLGFVPKVVESA